MNKRYMDFVPAAKPDSKVVEKPQKMVSVSNVRTKAVKASSSNIYKSTPKAKVVTEVEEVSIETIFAERPRPAGVSSGSKVPKLGVVEDYQPKFVKSEVQKRPLSSRFKKFSGSVSKRSAKSEGKNGAAAKVNSVASVQASASNAKAKRAKLSAKETAGLESIFENALKQAEGLSEDRKVAKIPKSTSSKSPFVNTEKIDKRPLSKNVYQKKVVVPKEEPSGPVTIIAKPDKDSKVGTIVAIVVTIILGATAGTVAFLLLPK